MPEFYIRQEDGLVTGHTVTDDDSVLEIDSRYHRVEEVYELFPEITPDNHLDFVGKIWNADNTLSDPPPSDPRPFLEIIKDGVVTSHFTRTDFKTLFTLAEKGAIYASTDPIVNAILEDINTAGYIDTADQRTIDGVNYLASVGLIDGSRIGEILVTHRVGEVIYPPS